MVVYAIGDDLNSIRPMTVNIFLINYSPLRTSGGVRMKGVVFLGDRQLEIQQFDDPVPGPSEVVLE